MQIIRDTSAITPEPCVATIGFFDGVHAGHRYLIQQVKEIAAAKGLRSALVTFPVHPRKVMNVEYHPELLTTPEEKISLLADIGVDYCLMLDFTPEISRLTAREFMTQLLKERYQVKYLVIGYDQNEPLSKPLNLYMERGEKIALVGANGIGKTTLLKSILGLIPALSGKAVLGDYLEIGYFEQEMAPGNTTTCIEEIWKEFPSYTQYQVRSALAKCGLTTKHIESQVRVLSGGEQAKVRLCKLINRETNLLLLDEPTNHLDVDAKDELKRALKEYRGSILLICHEPEFYSDVVTKVWDCREWSLRI